MDHTAFISARDPQNSRAIPGAIFHFLAKGEDTAGRYSLMEIHVKAGNELTDFGRGESPGDFACYLAHPQEKGELAPLRHRKDWLRGAAGAGASGPSRSSTHPARSLASRYRTCCDAQPGIAACRSKSRKRA